MQKIQNLTSGSLSSSTFYPSGICFLVPTYMLEKVIKEGRPSVRDKALYNLKISELLRGQRIVNSKIPSLAAAAHQEKRRVIYDMKNSEDVSALPGTPVRYEGSNDIGDKNVDASYKNSGIVYDFYEKIFNRNSMNDQGMTLVSSAHFGEGYDNALWNGTQMVYGDGSDTFLKRDSLTALDVTGHEQTHGVLLPINKLAIQMSIKMEWILILAPQLATKNSKTSIPVSLRYTKREKGLQETYLGFPFLVGNVNNEFYVRGPLILFPINPEYKQ